MAVQEIDRVQKHANRIASGKDAKVKPGQPIRITEAWTAGDCARQGDLYIDVVASIPRGYVKIDKPKDADRQLVPGNTQGARHCLDSLAGVTLYRPKDWGPESLEGPAFVLTEERTILHPTHGPVTIPAGFTVHCRYQQNLDEVTKRARRAAD